MASLKGIACLLSLALLLSIAYAGCYNNCNGHGTCRNDNCVCDDDWAGDDCSIRVRELRSGEEVTSRVDMWQWEYYKLNVARDTNIILEMTQLTTQSADCDIYVKRGAYPTYLSYDWRDISLQTNIRYEFNDAKAGTWYFGVVGFLTCDYKIKVTIVGSCLQGCNGHGECIEGACYCNPGWSGEACQYQDTALTVGQWTTSSVEKSGWSYFHVRLLQPANKITWEVEQLNTGTAYDVDLYVKHESSPNMWDWDYANGTTNPHTVLTISGAQAGFWYAGVYGFSCPDNRRCDFRIRVSLTGNENECPHQCSLHGQCSGSVCNCQPGYDGEYCQDRKVPLALNEVVTGLAGDQSWNYYFFNTSTLNPVIVSVQQGETGDCDLYIKGDRRPTRFDYDYFDIGLAKSFNVTIPQPGNTVWHIGIYGFSRCQYTLTVSTDRPSDDCLNGGYRTSPTSPCVCPPGFSGQRCEIGLTLLRPSQEITGEIRLNEWKYFNFSMNFYSTNIYIHLKETDEDYRGAVWLLAANGFAPTLREHDWSDVRTNSDLHTINIQRPQVPVVPPNYRSDIVIGVYGSPFLTKDKANFKLVAWAAPF